MTKTISNLLITSNSLKRLIFQFDFNLNYLKNYSTEINNIKDLYFEAASNRLFVVDRSKESIKIFLFKNESQLYENNTIKLSFNPRSLFFSNEYLYVGEEKRNIIVIDIQMSLLKTYSNVCTQNNSWILSLQVDSTGNIIYSCDADRQIYIITSLGLKQRMNIQIGYDVHSTLLDSNNRLIVGTSDNLMIF